MARRGGFRGGFSRFDRRDVGLKPENALSRVDRKCTRVRSRLCVSCGVRTKSAFRRFLATEVARRYDIGVYLRCMS
jgi:hypothetical protein